MVLPILFLVREAAIVMKTLNQEPGDKSLQIIKSFFGPVIFSLKSEG